jgi:hypothetical protein
VIILIKQEEVARLRRVLLTAQLQDLQEEITITKAQEVSTAEIKEQQVVLLGSPLQEHLITKLRQEAAEEIILPKELPREVVADVLLAVLQEVVEAKGLQVLLQEVAEAVLPLSLQAKVLPVAEEEVSNSLFG